MGNEFAITTQHCWIVGHAMVPAGHSQMPHDTTRASCKHHTCSSIHNGLHIRISHSKLIGQCQACGQDGQPRPILLHTPGREWHLCAQCQPVSVALALQTSEPSESRRQRRSHGPEARDGRQGSEPFGRRSRSMARAPACCGADERTRPTAASPVKHGARAVALLHKRTKNHKEQCASPPASVSLLFIFVSQPKMTFVPPHSLLRARRSPTPGGAVFITPPEPDRAAICLITHVTAREIYSNT